MRLNEREENEENASRRVPNFDGTNWDEFELKMMCFLELKDLWEVVETEPIESDATYAADAKKDKKAKAYIIMHVAEKYSEQVRGIKTSSLVWKELESLFQAKTMSQVILLRGELNKLCMAEDGDVVEYIGMLEKLQRKLKATSAPVSDEELIVRVIGSLPVSWDSFVQGLRSNTETLKKFDLVKAALVQEESNRVFRGQSKEKEKEKHHAFHVKARFNGECNNCGKKGHKKDTCWAKGGGAEGKGPKQDKGEGRGPKHEGRAYKAKSSNEQPWAFTAVNQEKNGEACVNSVRILDSGASEHMTSQRMLF